MENKAKKAEIDKILKRIQFRAESIIFLRRQQAEDRKRLEELESRESV